MTEILFPGIPHYIRPLETHTASVIIYERYTTFGMMMSRDR